MPSDRLAKTTFTGELTEGKGQVGRPKLRFIKMWLREIPKTKASTLYNGRIVMWRVFLTGDFQGQRANQETERARRHAGNPSQPT